MPSIIAEYWHPGNSLALFLDYDGTLTPLVPDPTQAILPPDGIELLRTLCRHPQIHLAIVSGRSVPQLQHFLGELLTEDITLCGLHGGEIYVPQKHQFLRQPHREKLLTQLQPIREMIVRKLTEGQLLESGVIIEDKNYSIAVHYRQAPTPVKSSVVELLHTLFTPNNFNNDLITPFKLQPGKEVIEILPHTFDKGDCVAFLWDLWQVQQGCYIGDDLTDEAAFAVVNQRGGLSIAVGKTPSATEAHHICPEVADVYRELAALGS
jgi:trehalose-phosphatase